jgi:hypothetical protein
MEAQYLPEPNPRRFLFSRRSGYQFEWLWGHDDQPQPAFHMRRVRLCGTDFPYCAPLHHIYSPSAGWLSESLTVQSPKFFGEREIDGHRCWGLQIHAASNLVYWLDPSIDGLPRLIEDVAASQAAWNWKCEEFRQLKTGHWFPWRGHFGHRGSVEGWFELQAVVLNETIPDEALSLPSLEAISLKPIAGTEKVFPKASGTAWSSLLGSPWTLATAVPLVGLICFWKSLFVPLASTAFSARLLVRILRRVDTETLPGDQCV